MAQECEKLANCGFFNTYKEAHDSTCKALIGAYCKGHMKAQCKRMEFSKIQGHPPPNDMLPSGQMFHGKTDLHPHAPDVTAQKSSPLKHWWQFWR